jgi:hypothetical protein
MHQSANVHGLVSETSRLSSRRMVALETLANRRNFAFPGWL